MADRYEDRDRRWDERRYEEERRADDRNTGLVDRARNWWDRNVNERDRDRGEWDRERNRDWRTERSQHDEQWRAGSREPWLERDRSADTYSGSYGRPTFGREGRGEYAETEGRRTYGASGAYGGGMMSSSTGSTAGSYAGRGPKNWRRPDERILEDINEQLTRDPQVDATDIEVAVLNGEVTLGGFVNDRREKHLAEECVYRVLGVRDVNNQIRSKQGVISSAFRGDDQTR